MITIRLRRLALIFALVLVSARPALVRAQAADSTQTWHTSVLGNLSATQVGFQNWQGGGINSLAMSAGVDGAAERATDQWQQKYEMRLALGVVKQDTLEFRKAEDIILLAANLQYLGDGFFGHFNPTLAASVRTQFTEGFSYDKDPLFELDPVGEARTPPVKVSDLFSPATLQQSVGLTYNPNAWFTHRFGVAAKETVVTIERLRALYGVDPADAVRFELGLESVTEIDREVFENVRYKSRLGLFATFNKAGTPDMLWENLVSMKVNAWLHVNFEFVALFDNDISDRIQLKEVLSVGISFLLI